MGTAAETELPRVPWGGRPVVLYWLGAGHTQRVVTLGKQVSCPSWGTVRVNIGIMELLLELVRNDELTSAVYTETHYDEAGDRVTISRNQTNHCLYQGHVTGSPQSWLSLTLSYGLSGIVVVDSRDSYYLQPIRQHGSHYHILYRTEHLPIRSGSCGNPVNNQSDISMIKEFVHQHHRFRRDAWNSMKYVELYLVADHTMFQKFSRDLSVTKGRLLEIANHVDKFYRAFNIRIALIGLEVWTHADQIRISEDATKTLYAFLKWRHQLSVHTRHDNAQLVTGITFKGTTIGMATLEGMCSPDSSGGVSMDHSAPAIGAAATMAHEIGHNLGLRHDGPGCCLQAEDEHGGCIMAAATGDPFPRLFSSCSKRQLREFLEKGGGMCLFNLPDLSRLYGAGRCGNHYVEEGEECDCGEVQECVNPCCNPNNCTLKRGAHCAHGVCCNNCQFRSAGTVCRVAAGPCDLPEYCTGSSAYCPGNVYHLDGSECEGNRGYCYTGMCQSHQLQCEELWGPGARSAPAVCFEDVNGAGNVYGNCGKDPSGNFVKCWKSDAMCGKIQCQSPAVSPKEWNTVSIDTTVRLGGRDIKCRGIYLHSSEHGQEDLPDPGLVKTGTKCGDGKVCLDRRCQNISLLGLRECSGKCHGHGVCNSNRNCHCDPHWAPPFCDQGGLGGSIDSGPILPNDQKPLLIGLLLIFLLVIPGSVLSVFCCYRHRAVIHTQWQHWYRQPAKAHRPVSRRDEDSSQPSVCLRILQDLSPMKLDQAQFPSQPSRPGHMVHTSPKARPLDSRPRNQGRPQRPPAPSGTTFQLSNNQKGQPGKREPPRIPPPPSLSQRQASQPTYQRVPQQPTQPSHSAAKRNPVVQPHVAEIIAQFSNSPGEEDPNWRPARKTLTNHR